MNRKNGAILFSDWVLLAAIVCVGSFYEFISCALSAVMCGYLIYRLCKEKRLVVRKNLLSVAVLALCLGYGVTALWGIDNGMALMGFFKFLPLGLYLLCLWQEEREGCALQILPYVVAAMAVISAVGMQFAPLEDWFSVAGRLAGFFQYPNTFAVLLLICQLLLLKKEGKKIWDYGVMLVLIAALLYTGSRTAFVVFALSNVAMLFAVSKKKTRTVLLALGAAAVVAVVIFAFAENSVLRRYLTISLRESTFVGRILYAVDALPLLLKYPFGMGYMGYYYMQESIQTGVYSVAYIHNDFFQLFLDVGWVPAGLFVIALICWFCKKQICAADKIVVGAFCFHSLLDFDLQFLGMFMLLILLLAKDAPYEKGVWKFQKPLKYISGALAVICLYLSVALVLAHVGCYKASDAMFPANTRNKLTMLGQAEDLEEADKLADKILEVNQQYFAPYWIKAKYAASQGKFTEMIHYQKKAIAQSPFNHALYEEYCQWLVQGVRLYQENGDTQSAQFCKQELVNIQRRLRDNVMRQSELGKLIADQPITELPQEYQDIIRQIEE